MKIFTRILFVLALSSVFTFGNAQTYDLAISDVGTASNSSNEIPPDIEAPIFFTIQNNGGNDIPSGTQIWIAVTVNANYFINPDTLQFNGDFTSGSEITLYSTAGYTFLASAPQYEICAGAYFVDSTSESNPTNNLNCEDFIVTSAINNDWAAMSVSIEEPTNLDGFDLDNQTNTVPELDSVVLILQNNSNITFPAFYGVDYVLSVGGDSSAITGFLGNNLGPGEQTTRIVSNAAAFPEMVQDSGSYDFCVTVAEEGDNTDSNNTTCESFTIIDSYDPFHPSNWPLGQDEVTGSQLNVVPLLDAIRIEGVEHATDVTVTDMSGRLIKQLKINEDASIQLQDERSGVYIIQAADLESGQIELKKFSKP